MSSPPLLAKFVKFYLLQCFPRVVPAISDLDVIQFYPSILGLELVCSIGSGSVTCPNNGSNMWFGSIQMQTPHDTLTITFSDQLGNVLEMSIELELDDASPECTFPGSEELGQHTFVVDSAYVEVVCSDTQTNPVWVGWVGENGISDYIESSGTEIRSFINLSGSDNWTFSALDVAGNQWAENFSFIEDQAPPEVICRPSRLGHYPDKIHSTGNESIQCVFTDQLSISFNYSFIRSGQVIGQGSGESKLLLAQIPPSSDGDDILLAISVSDALGNQKSVSFEISIDTTRPGAAISSFSNTNIILPNDLADILGQIEILTTDQNLDYMEATTNCGNKEAYLNSSSPINFLSVSDHIDGGCRVLSISVRAVDKAGNSRLFDRDLVVDRNSPEVEIGSSCYFQNQTNLISAPGCNLFFDILDDSGYNANITARIGGHTLGSESNSLDIPLSDFLESEVITPIRIEVVDVTGKETVLIKTIRISDSFSVGVDTGSCRQSGINCETDRVIVNSGEHSFSIDNLEWDNSVPIVQIIGSCRLPRDCHFENHHSALSIDTSDLGEGLHIMDVVSLDSLEGPPHWPLKCWLISFLPNWSLQLRPK